MVVLTRKRVRKNAEMFQTKLHGTKLNASFARLGKLTVTVDISLPNVLLALARLNKKRSWSSKILFFIQKDDLTIQFYTISSGHLFSTTLPPLGSDLLSPYAMLSLIVLSNSTGSCETMPILERSQPRFSEATFWPSTFCRELVNSGQVTTPRVVNWSTIIVYTTWTSVMFL